MNDVAHPSFVTVRRPTTMLPYDFKQALADLAAMSFIDAKLVAGDHAVVEMLDDADRLEQLSARLGVSLGVETSGASSMPPEVGHVVDRVERRERVSSAQTSNEHAASAATEKRMTASRIEEVFELVESGVSRSADMAKELGLTQANVGNYLRALINADRVERTGKTSSSRFYVKGKAPAAIAVSSAKTPRVAKPRRKPAAAMVHVPKVKDLTPAPPSSGARFTLRYFQAHVDCASAQDVAQLLGALKEVFS